MAIGAAGGNDAPGAGRMKENATLQCSIFGISPKGWHIDRLRDRLSRIVGGEWGEDPATSDDGIDIVVVRVADIRGLDVTTTDLTIRNVKETKIQDRLIGKQSILIEKSGGGEKSPVGRSVLGRAIHEKAICSNFMAKTDCLGWDDTLFIAYLLDAMYSSGVNTAHIQQTTGIQNLRVADYLNSIVALPPLPEQVRIAAYLDASCAAIDAAVAAKKKQIEALIEMHKAIIAATITKGLNCFSPRKNSGIEWFGEIPQHWKCEHLKRVTTRIQTGVTPPTDNPDYYFEGIIPWFAPGSYEEDLELRVPRKLISKLALQENVLRMFPEQTVFLIGIGATIGKVRIITNPASCNQQIIGIVTNHKMLGRYLAYQLQTYEDIIPGIATATTLPIFDQVKTGYLPVLHPPNNEQQEICDFLDEKLANIKNILTLIESQIATLIDYRKSLIHECVTGQRRISETDVAKVERTLEQAAGLPQQ